MKNFNFFFSGDDYLTENIPMSEKRENTALDKLEQEMLNEVKALFNKYREKLEQVQNTENNGNAMSIHSTV